MDTRQGTPINLSSFIISTGYHHNLLSYNGLFGLRSLYNTQEIPVRKVLSVVATPATAASPFCDQGYRAAAPDMDRVATVEGVFSRHIK